MIFLAPKKIAQQSLQQLADRCTQETSAYRGEEALGDRDIAFRVKKEVGRLHSQLKSRRD